MIKYNDIKKGDLLVLKNSRNVIGTIIGLSGGLEKNVFYAPDLKVSQSYYHAIYSELSKNFDIIKPGKKDKKKSRKSFSIRTYIRKRLGMI